MDHLTSTSQLGTSHGYISNGTSQMCKSQMSTSQTVHLKRYISNGTSQLGTSQTVHFKWYISNVHYFKLVKKIFSRFKCVRPNRRTPLERETIFFNQFEMYFGICTFEMYHLRFAHLSCRKPKDNFFENNHGFLIFR